ncbi:DNA gyrase subunit A [Vitreoscilla massiliensis]|uniref:DNA gyrase subunit A n=1 Tax=Vitreoscilla massiliensis TaxID=1689272 RepID=A0ABY4DYH5_9NEIS|nr:DNA gyrase subunit A [Vitreoscilla massiliensis]UOO88583.1 DNA gyrase subunit A [Vitreoscilla massiliensis]
MTDSLFAKETIAISLEEEMKRSYLDYAMSVIVGRALPDVRDGLKPVHRRVLYAMHELNNDWNRAYKKSARIVGDVIGKYHPHGDTAVYDTIVRMAQDFSMRYMLVDGQGNFGSVDGDSAAAMRYTEIRMAKIAHELLADIDKETVNFGPNYDGSESEPLILPARVPALLVNGSSGIAVGMATNIPPHNLREVINACVELLHNPELSIDEIIDLIPAPDFPTGATIYGLSGVREGYRTGRGRVVMRGKTHIEPLPKHPDREAIIIDEIPYQVNKAKLVEKIGELVREKILEGVSDLRDESDKSGMRVVIELKRNENAEVVLNQLYKLTQLQDSFGINMVALVDGQPRLLNVKQILSEFLRHRREVVTRRTMFELKKARERGHILEGLAVALSNVDEIIALIKASATPPEAKQALLARAWQSDLVNDMLSRVEGDLSLVRPENVDAACGLHDGAYHFSEAQAQAILEMRLQRLTGLEQDKIIAEYKDIMATILDLLDILSKPERINQIIDDELVAIKEQYGDERRSEINPFGGDIADEDLIPPQDMIVTLSHAGYIKAQPVTDYQAQRRGGRGKQAAATKEEDFIETLFSANTHDYLLCFTSFGRCHWIKVYKLPQGGRQSRGRPVNNVLELQEGEKISAILPVREFIDTEYVFMATANGTVKKTALTDFSRPRTAGIIAINLDDNDSLVGVAKTTGNDHVMLFSSNGKAIRFDENDVRAMGRTAAGVRGMKLLDDAKVISLLVSNPCEDGACMVLTATANGYGKRTPVEDYRLSGRATQGVIAIDTGERNGELIAASLVADSDDLMLITSGGVLIRTKVNQVRETGRAAQGVRLINLDEGENLVSLTRVAESEEDECEAEEGMEDSTDSSVDTSVDTDNAAPDNSDDDTAAE